MADISAALDLAVICLHVEHREMHIPSIFDACTCSMPWDVPHAHSHCPPLAPATPEAWNWSLKPVACAHRQTLADLMGLEGFVPAVQP